MKLNDFLLDKLNVEFKEKYNKLAVYEIVNNKEKYPLICEEIEDIVSINAARPEEEFYGSEYFDSIDSVVTHEETMELYKAFIRVFLKDISKNDFSVEQTIIGIHYLRTPDVTNIEDSVFHGIIGMRFISLTGNTKLIKEEIIADEYKGGRFYRIHKKEEKKQYFIGNYKKELNKVKKELIKISEKDDLLSLQFSNKDLTDNKIQINDDVIGYSCDFYGFKIEGNFVLFNSSKREMDSFGSIIRTIIMNSLTNEEKQSDIVENIK